MTRHNKFRDREYRASYAESFLDTFIATQIRVLREQRGWTQSELAELLNTQQSRISSLEDVNYSRWSISTLKRLARAFDVPLQVSFGTFGSLIKDIDSLGRTTLERPTFDSDPFFQGEQAVPSSTVVYLQQWKESRVHQAHVSATPTTSSGHTLIHGQDTASDYKVKHG